MKLVIGAAILFSLLSPATAERKLPEISKKHTVYMKSQSHVIAGGHSAGSYGWMKLWTNENPQYDVALEIHKCVESVELTREQENHFVM